MANLPEQAVYEPGIYQIETNDLVKGGADGVTNVPAAQLANRTQYLKDIVDSVEPLTLLDAMQSFI